MVTAQRSSIILFLLTAGFFLFMLLLGLSNPPTASGGEAPPTNTVTPTVTITATAVLSDSSFLPLIRLDPTATPTATPSCVPPAAIAPSDLGNEATTVSGINTQRSNSSLPPLNLNNKLIQSGRSHSLDMAVNNFTDHSGSDGSTPGQRIAKQCYDASWYGEIIGWGFSGNPQEMLNWWMNSPIHRDMILSSNFTQLGAGYIRLPGSAWQHYWTVNFGRPAASGTALNVENMHLCTDSMENERGGSSIIYWSDTPCEDGD